MSFIAPSAQLYHPVFGVISLFTSSDGLFKVSFNHPGNVPGKTLKEPSLLSSANREALDISQKLLGYLTGSDENFDIPIDWSIFSDFYKSVLKQTNDIPFGKILTYGCLAELLGDAKKSRAVGAALGQNPIPIIIPCHRVVGSDGSLHGYSAPGGLATKAWLLTLEGHKFKSDSPFLLQKDENGNF